MIKKFLFSLCILFLCFNQLTFAQKEESNVIVCEDFHITRPLIEINAEFPVNNRKIEREGGHFGLQNGTAFLGGWKSFESRRR